MIVADTDVLIDALNGWEPSTTRVLRLLEAGSLATTAVSLLELLQGVRKPDLAARTESLVGGLAIFPFDEAASRAAAEAGRRLAAEGRGLAMADLQIAGICLSRAAPLFTRNRAHFERIEGLVLV